MVAIVGRPNVGKSTLFNRLARRRLAIVDDEPGVTRDRLYAMARVPEARFHLIDTGGLDPDNTHTFFTGMREQAQLAMEEADVIIHVCDAREGVHPDDRFVADLLRKSGKPTITVANKTEGRRAEELMPELYELGVGQLLPVSAEHALGITDLVEAVLAALPEELADAARAQADEDQAAPKGRAARRARAEEEAAAAEELAPEQESEKEDRGDLAFVPEQLAVAVVGRPNAGKSSLINALLGQPRLMVSDIPGTTRDAVDSLVEDHGKSYRVIDTAGLRRKKSVALKLEKYSVVAALRALEQADVVLLVFDGYEGITEQDARIAQLASEAGKALVLVVNKWDLVEPGAKDMEKYTERIYKAMAFVSYAPAMFVSALKGKGIERILPMVDQVAGHHFRRVGTGRLNRAFEKAQAGHHLPAFKGRRVNLYYATQVAIAPPTVVVACNMPEGIHFSYRRYLTNVLRDEFGFFGTPLRILFRRRGKDMGLRGHTHRKRRDPTQHG